MGDDKKNFTSGTKKAKSDKQVVKVGIKRGATVDEIVPDKDQYRIFRDGKKIYSAILNK